MANQQEMDIAWLAGIFDGEGTLSLTKNHGTKHPDWNARKVDLAVANSDERVILKAVNTLMSIGIRPYITCGEPRKNQRQKAWRVGLTKRVDVLKLMDYLIPHLTAKREQAILMRRYVESRLQREYILGQLQPNGKNHKLTRRQISPEENALGDQLLEFNNPFSRSSQTAREAAKTDLGRMIQSGLM